MNSLKSSIKKRNTLKSLHSRSKEFTRFYTKYVKEIRLLTVFYYLKITTY